MGFGSRQTSLSELYAVLPEIRLSEMVTQTVPPRSWMPSLHAPLQRESEVPVQMLSEPLAFGPRGIFPSGRWHLWQSKSLPSPGNPDKVLMV